MPVDPDLLDQSDDEKWDSFQSDDVVKNIIGE